MKLFKKAQDMSTRELAHYIDQLVLKPGFTEDDIRRYAQEGIGFGCRTICINPSSLPIVAPMVEGTQTGLCVVCDFPFGDSTTEMKAAMAECCCSQWNVDDLDIVANYGRLRSGEYDYVTADLRLVVKACHRYGTDVKVILETDALSRDQIEAGVRCAIAAGADFVDTSAGFSAGGEARGADPEVVRWIMDAAQGKIKVKASGCIRTRERFLELIDMGVDRMGIGFRSTPEVLGFAPKTLDPAA